MGNRDYGQFITRCLCCSFLLRGRTPHTLPRLQCEVPLTGDSSPQTSPTSVHPTGCSSSWTAPVWVLPTGCSPSGTGCSSVCHPWGHKPCQQTYSTVGSSLHGSTVPDRSLLQCGLPTGPLPPSGIYLLRRGVPSTATGRYLLHCGPPWTAGEQPASAWSSSQAAREGSVSSTSSPSFFTDIGVCRVVSFTSSHSSLFTAVSPPFVFFSSLS